MVLSHAMTLDLSQHHIIQATEQDLDAILKIEEASFSSPWTRKMIHAEIVGNPFASFMLIQDRSTKVILGYICYWVVFEELRIMNVAVHAPVRRSGLANMLVKYALEDGRQRGAVRANLEVRDSNIPAQSLYRGLGFTDLGKRPAYYTNPVEDALLMELGSIARGTRSKGVI